MKKGWEIKKLGEIILENKKSILKSKGNEVGDYPFFISGIKVKTHNNSIIDGQNIYLPTGGNFYVHFYEGKAAYSTDTWSLRTNDKVNIKYLYFFLLMNREFINDKHFKGATIKHLQKNDFRAIEIPLPPLTEQHSIVAILDKTFAAIDKAIANVEHNLKNTKELFKNYLQGVFENGNWEKVKLSELAKDITDGDHMPPPKSEEGFPFITISNINKQNHQIDFSDTFKVPKVYFDKLKENRKPKKGDVLYTVTGSFGIPVLIEDDFEFCFQRHIGLIRPKENVSSKWLYYWILSPQAFFLASDTATGTAQKTVSLTALRNFTLPKMTLKEQQNNVQKLEVLSAKTEKLEAIYQQKLNDFEELKKSILQKAFNGELKTEKLELI